MTKVFVYFLILALLLSVSCTTRYMDKSETLPANKRVAVLVVEESGGTIVYGMQRNLIYNQLLRSNLIPVTLKEVDTGMFGHLGRSYGNVAALMKNLRDEKENSAPDETLNAILIPSLTNSLDKYDVDYLLIVSMSVVGLDKHLQGLLIKVDDMTVVASKYYDYTIMKELCIPLTFLWGASILTCPWLFIPDPDEARYEMVGDLLRDLM